MNKILFLIIALISLNINAQNLNEKEIKKLENFGIDFKNLTTTDFNVQQDLNSILLYNKKTRRRKTASIILGSLSAISTTMGILLISNKGSESTSPYNEAEGYAQVFGSFFIAVGTIEAGIAIPIFLSSKRKKRKRNELIKIYNKDYK